MESSKLSRWGGPAVLLGGVLLGLVGVAHAFLESHFGNTQFADSPLGHGVYHAPNVLVNALLAIGITGVYGRQAGLLGEVGKADFYLSFIGFALTALLALGIVFRQSQNRCSRKFASSILHRSPARAASIASEQSGHVVSSTTTTSRGVAESYSPSALLAPWDVSLKRALVGDHPSTSPSPWRSSTMLVSLFRTSSSLPGSFKPISFATSCKCTEAEGPPLGAATS